MTVQAASSPDDRRHADDPDTTSVTCDLDQTSAGAVRAIVRRLLTGRSGLVVEDAVLVADELVSNAHRHGDTPRSCRLALLERGGCLRIEVGDAAPTLPRIRTPDSSGGRGLILVDRLSSRWGVQHHGSHKTVWAELDLDGAGSSGHVPHITAAPTTGS
jgi:hypothetical protein